jgi:hypothetical protein
MAELWSHQVQQLLHHKACHVAHVHIPAIKQGS